MTLTGTSNASVSIVFILTGNEHRNGAVNGYTIRQGTGASGTDWTTILVAEHLAKVGHRVVIASPNGGEPGSIINFVTYTNLAFDRINDRTFDVMVNTLWFEDFASLPINITRAVVSWLHCPYLYGFTPLQTLIRNNNLRYGIVHLSNWCKGLNTRIAHDLDPCVVEDVIPNPIATDMIQQVMDEVKRGEITKREEDFIFHAEWIRGGQMASEMISQLPARGWDNPRMLSCSYLMHRPHDSHIVPMGSVGKIEVLRAIARSGYFLYPLVNKHNAQMHKDTFACVVAEACALGAIVVTYPVAALPETYDDTCAWLTIPESCRDKHDIVNAPLSTDEGLLETQHIFKKLDALKQDDALRSSIRSRAQQRVMELYNVERIGQMWEGFLARLVC